MHWREGEGRQAGRLTHGTGQELNIGPTFAPLWQKGVSAGQQLASHPLLPLVLIEAKASAAESEAKIHDFLDCPDGELDGGLKLAG